MINKEQFLKDLNDLTSFAFDNEKEFLDKFFIELRPIELMDFHMAAEKIKVYLVLEYFDAGVDDWDTQTILTDLPTNTYIDWYLSKQTG